MIKKGCLWLLLAILVTAISPLAYASGRPVIQTVSVQIAVLSDYELHPLIEARVKESIEKVANRVLVGQEISVMQKTQKEISEVVKTVFNTVLRGYAVEDVKMVVGEKTIIVLALHPTSLLVEKVDLNLHLPGVNDKIVQVIDGEVAEISRQVETMLLGVPVEAFVWAEDIIKPALLQWIRWELPGFQPALDLALGPVIRVHLTLKPEAPLVNDIQVNLETQSLPHFAMGLLEERLEAELSLFHGLPVRFLEKYQDRVLEEVEKALREKGWSKHIYWRQKPQLTLGPTTRLDLDLEWTDYQIDLIGEVSLGLHAPSPAFHISLGKRWGSRTMFKLTDTFTWQRPTGTVSISLEHQVNHAWTTQLQYSIREAAWRAALDWRHDRYGITFSQPVPGRLSDLKVSLHHDLATHSQVALVYEKKNLWVTLQQTF